MGSRSTIVVAAVVLAAAALVGGALWALKPGAFLSGRSGDDAPPPKPHPPEIMKPEAVKALARRSGGAGALVGSVRVYGTDKPVVGAKVSIWSEDMVIDAVTKDDGSFAIARIPKADDWGLDVAPPEGLSAAKLTGLIVLERKTTDVGAIYLAPGFEMPGIVVDERGAPVPGASVVVTAPRPSGKGFDFLSMIRELPRPPRPTHMTQSGDDGRFRLTGVPPGTYLVYARKPGFATGAQRSVLVEPAAALQPIRLVLPKGFRVTGRVVRRDDASVAGIPVIAFRDDDLQTFGDAALPTKVVETTNRDGEFVLEGLATGRWSVVAAPQGETMTAAENVVVPRATFVEIRLEGGASLAGRVTGDDDAPVAGAEVFCASGKGVANAQTDSDGRYAMHGLPVGTAEIFLVQADGWCTFGAESVFGGRSDKGLELLEGANTRDVKLSPGGKIRGVVVEDGTTTPVPGATVSIVSFQSFFGGAPVATTGDDGRFELAGVGIGGAVLSVRKSGWCQVGAMDMKSVMEGVGPFGGGKKDEKDSGAGPKVVVAKQGDVVERTIGMARATVLKGRVVGPGGEPVGGARVSAAMPELRDDFAQLLGGVADEKRLSDADGRFEVASPTAKGDVVLTATAPGRIPAKSDAVAVGGEKPPPDIVLKLGAGGTIDGKITDAKGAPVEGATIAVSRDDSGEEQGATSGADGAYRIDVVAPGKIVLSVRDGKHAAARVADRVVEDGKRVTVDVQLDPGFAITGKVSRIDAKPIAHPWVEVRRDGGDEHEDVASWDDATVENDGRFVVAALPAGKYRLIGHAQGLADGEPVVVAAGTDGVELRLATPLAIAGVVKFKDGRPAAGVEVTARLKKRGEKRGDVETSVNEVSSSRTGADGSFRVEPLAAGEFEVTAGARGTNVNLRPTKTAGVAAGTESLVIEVDPGLVIVGRVLGEGGAPLSSGRVSFRTAVDADRKNDEEDDADEDSMEGPPSVAIQEGRFTINGLSPKSYLLTVQAEKFAPQIVRVVAGSSDVVVHLVRGGTIKGRVVFADGKPAAHADVGFVSGDDAPEQPESTTDDDGSFTCECVAPGARRLTVSMTVDGADYEGEARDVRVVDGQTIEHVEIRLKKSE